MILCLLFLFLPSPPFLTYFSLVSFHSCLPSSFSLFLLSLPSLSSFCLLLFLFTSFQSSFTRFLPSLLPPLNSFFFFFWDIRRILCSKLLVVYIWKYLMHSILKYSPECPCRFTMSRSGTYIWLEITVCINGHPWRLVFTVCIHEDLTTMLLLSSCAK